MLKLPHWKSVTALLMNNVGAVLYVLNGLGPTGPLHEIALIHA